LQQRNPEIRMNRRAFVTTLAALPVLAAPSVGLTQAAKAPATAPEAPKWPIAPQFYPTEVRVRKDLAVGSLIIVSDKFFLYHIVAPGRAMRYGVAVGKGELKFRGQAVVGRKVEWPSWKPTPEPAGCAGDVSVSEWPRHRDPHSRHDRAELDRACGLERVPADGQ
jgi:lipoprotein-anchoring transpeptidase ErfK/SrfK